MQHYFLRENVFFCIVDNHCVFLDLRNDQYLCLEPKKTAIFKAFFGKKSQNTSKEEIKKLADELFFQELITLHPNNHEILATAPPQKPVKDLIGYDIGKKPKIHLGHILCFLIAATSSKIRLKHQPLDKIIARVKKKKAHYHKKNRIQKIPFNRLKELVEIFNRLRPLLFTAQNQCLYDALSLNAFLNKYHIYPDMVFGVKMGPFAAHCWVQYNDVILNDTVAMTLLQTPIMVV